MDAAHVYAFVIGEGLNHFHALREYSGPPIDEWPGAAPRGNLQDVRNLNKKLRIEILKLYQS